MKEKLRLYLEENIKKDKPLFGSFKRGKVNYDSFYESELLEEVPKERACAAISIDNYINDNKDENKFQKLLFNHIDRRNLKDSDVYNKVNIDRRLFSKIRSDSNYHPSKETVILLAISLELSEDELEDLLVSASYSLPKNNYFDLIIRFCFKEKIYDLFTINEYLNDYNCKVLAI